MTKLSYITCFLYLTLLPFATFAEEATTPANTSFLSPSELHTFCTEKMIWTSFGIELDGCLKASQVCAQKTEFANIDPTVLSEGFYRCVFNQLGISVD